MSTTEKYIFGRGYQASLRLSMQHMIWRQTVGWNLHPDIPKPGPDTRLAEVAIGNGHWLADVVKEYPDLGHATGFDISLAQLAPPQSWPDKVQFRTWDLFTDPPEDVQGTFDIVHIRLIGGLIKDNKPQPIIERVFKLLKPGGWFQWDEYDFPHTHVDSTGSSAEFPKLAEVVAFILKPQRERGGYTWWKPEGADTLKRAGFQSIKYVESLEQYTSNRPLMKIWNDHHLSLLAEFSSTVYRDDPEAHAANMKFFDEAYEESQKGGSIVLRPGFYLAQKPS